MASWRWLTLPLLLHAVAVRAQDAGELPPKLGQPADFSSLVGVFQLRAEAKPRTITVEEPVTLTVTITGRAAAAYAPKRDQLRIFPEGTSRDFFIEPAGEKEVDGAWEFSYRLRPKHSRVQFVPGLRLVYYSPRQRRYQTAYADAIPLTVTARQDTAPKIAGLKVMQAPATFFELAESDVADDRIAVVLIQSPLVLLGMLLLPPVICIIAGWWWRRRSYADPTFRYRRLFDQTVAALARPPSDAASLAQTLTDYLRRRMNLRAVEPTPVEVERWLKRRGVAKKVREQWREMLNSCDAERFAPAQVARPAIDGVQATTLLRLLEEDRCVSER
jgi:hypothetical protein